MNDQVDDAQPSDEMDEPSAVSLMRHQRIADTVITAIIRLKLAAYNGEDSRDGALVLLKTDGVVNMIALNLSERDTFTLIAGAAEAMGERVQDDKQLH